ncbi:MAG: dTMP kinase [Caldisericia bacterium]|nr:dTMP kinase [Caldisericia bacterium]
MNKNKLFIVFEGIDGCGKSTQIRKLSKYLSSLNEANVCTKEPTDGAIGVLIRNSIKEENVQFSPLTQLFLFSADRVEHANWIQRQLDARNHVLCDRFIDSTIAYQGRTKALEKAILEINSLSLNFIQPDIVFFIDVSVDIALKRIKNRVETDCFENFDFLKSVRQRYLNRIKSKALNYELINGEKSIEETFSSIKKTLLNFRR